MQLEKALGRNILHLFLNEASGEITDAIGLYVHNNIFTLGQERKLGNRWFITSLAKYGVTTAIHRPKQTKNHLV